MPEKKKIYLSTHSQLRYLEVLGSIFTCTIMFRYTFVIPFPANTPKWSFSVLAQWTGGVTVVFSCLALVYVWKLRINAELSNIRSYFDDAFIILTWFTPLWQKKKTFFKVSISIDILKCSVVYLPVHLSSCPLLEKPGMQTHL